jgi:hypothetical protein
MVVKMSHLMAEREKEGPRTRYILQRHVSSDLLPPTTTYFVIVHSAMSSSMD